MGGEQCHASCGLLVTAQHVRADFAVQVTCLAQLVAVYSLPAAFEGSQHAGSQVPALRIEGAPDLREHESGSMSQGHVCHQSSEDLPGLLQRRC